MPDIDLGIGAIVVNETLVEERGVYVLIYFSDEGKPYLKLTVNWRPRQWQPTPVLLPGISHGRRSLVGCRPWGHKESDTTE